MVPRLVLKNSRREVHDMVQRMTEKRTDQLISWGLGVIGLLLGTVGALVNGHLRI
jgi:hypothetical protein